MTAPAFRRQRLVRPGEGIDLDTSVRAEPVTKPVADVEAALAAVRRRAVDWEPLTGQLGRRTSSTDSTKPLGTLVPAAVRGERTPMPKTREEWDRYVSDLLFDGGEIRLPDETAERVARHLCGRS